MIVDHTRQVVAAKPTVAVESSGGDESTIQYRSVCKTAVLALVFAIFSLSSALSSAFLIFPIIAAILGGYALVQFRRYPDELVGRPMAHVGLWVGLVAFVGGIAWHSYCYYTEVPPNYDRISFRMLKPERGTRKPYAAGAEALDGKRVFIKGYVRPSDAKKNLTNFVLVGDFGQCCFGGSPKMTDVIAVSLQNNLTVDYSWRLRHIGGVFRLNRNPRKYSEKDIPQVVYSIEADYLK
jgi:hypothetical protein